MTDRYHVQLVSSLRHDSFRHYITDWIARPDEASEFDNRTRDVRRRPAEEWIENLLARGYDGLRFTRRGQAVPDGHIFFRRFDDAINAFSLSTGRSENNAPFVRTITRGLLHYAWALPEITIVRVGAKTTCLRPRRSSSLAYGDARDVDRARYETFLNT
jgi:hypothetical protein